MPAIRDFQFCFCEIRGTGDGEKEEEGGVDLPVACWILVLVGFGDMYTRVARLASSSSLLGGLVVFP